MVVRKDLPIVRIVWSLRHTLAFFFIVSALACLVHHYTGPWRARFGVSLTVIGLALSIFLGSRVRFGYDRWWEGRKFSKASLFIVFLL